MSRHLAQVDDIESSLASVVNSIIAYISDLPISDSENLKFLPSTDTFPLRLVKGTSGVILRGSGDDNYNINPTEVRLVLFTVVIVKLVKSAYFWFMMFPVKIL